jgi:hypothetical protein
MKTTNLQRLIPDLPTVSEPPKKARRITLLNSKAISEEELTTVLALPLRELIGTPVEKRKPEDYARALRDVAILRLFAAGFMDERIAGATEGEFRAGSFGAEVNDETTFRAIDGYLSAKEASGFTPRDSNPLFYSHPLNDGVTPTERRFSIAAMSEMVKRRTAKAINRRIWHHSLTNIDDIMTVPRESLNMMVAASKSYMGTLICQASEEAFAAAWHRDIEYIVFRATTDGNKAKFRAQYIDQLTKLYRALDGWTYHNGKTVEFIKTAEWLPLYYNWLAASNGYEIE